MATQQLLPTWTVADRLRKARQFAGLSVDDMAEQLGVSDRTVRNYESGANPRPAALKRWAAVTNVPVDWLESGTSQSTCNRALPLAA